VTATVAILAVAGIVLPHIVRLGRARPLTAATFWTAALTLRALITVSVALYVLVVFPDTAAFKVLTHWCEHSVLPLVGLHVDLEGHTLGAVGMLVPVVTVAFALMRAAVRMMRVARSVDRMLESAALGRGPDGSVIVGGPEVVVAAAGIRRPTVVVTAGALATLDDDELAAGMAHEKGHIARRHHLWLAYAEACRAVATVLPGTRRAASELRFQLERDADEWALRRAHDPYALASAICKAATMRAETHPAVVSLGGGGVERRLDRLMDEAPVTSSSLRRRLVDSAAVLMACIALSSMVAIPAEALAGGGSHVSPHLDHHCVD
jgi:beta-lactamase regulating signal transducer with metallopeptidase domain